MTETRQEQTQQAEEKIEHPTETFVCDNSRCKYHQKERTVRMAHLGKGLYLRATVICACGWAPRRFVTPGRG